MILINRITLPHVDLNELLREARAEGYDFLDVLEEDWANGSNRFDGSEKFSAALSIAANSSP